MRYFGQPNEPSLLPNQPYLPLKLILQNKTTTKKTKRVLSLFISAIAEDYNQEGDTRLNKNEFGSALDFYTKGIELKCKDDQLNATMYTNRARVHFCVGKRNICELYFSTQYSSFQSNRCNLMKYIKHKRYFYKR